LDDVLLFSFALSAPSWERFGNILTVGDIQIALHLIHSHVMVQLKSKRS